MAFSDVYNLSSKTYPNPITFFMFNISFTNIKQSCRDYREKDLYYKKLGRKST